MQIVNLTEGHRLSLEALKSLAACGGPCISILIPLHTTPQNSVRLKQAIKRVEEILAGKGIPEKQARELLEPLHHFEIPDDQKSLAIFISSETFLHMAVPETLDDGVVVADHFYVRPLLPLLESGRLFYTLALSQKHIRLLRCNGGSFEEVELPASAPKSLHGDMNTEPPDHTQDNHSTGGPSTGSMRGVMFSTNSDREDKDEYLQHFYKDVDKGLCELLNGDRAPVVLAGVEKEIALYRRGSSYPHLAEAAVHGSADGLKRDELHKRALEVAQAEFHKDVEKALSMYGELGSERTSTSVKEILRAGWDGRILYLFLGADAELMGNFDEASYNVRAHKQPLPGDEDLLNAAAIQTIRHAGTAYVVPRASVPNGAPMAAVFRW